MGESGDELAQTVAATVSSVPASMAAHDLVGTRVGRYMLERKLGAGGMGAVYAARDPELDRVVAIKLLHAGLADQRPILIAEGQAIAKLRHPNVVTVFDIGTSDEELFIAMEYVEGGTLRAWRDAQPRSEREILDAYLAAGRGLAAAHAVGLVHRDFKPDNVLTGTDGRVVVTDFGLAREMRRDDVTNANDVTETATVVGTPAYMSPEQFVADPIDARSDQFSFCVALFEALYGKRPFAGATFFTLQEAVLGGQLEAPAKIASPKLHAALLKGMATKREARWSSMDALLREIAPRASRRTVVAIAAAGIALAGIAIAGVLVPRGSSADTCARSSARLTGIWDDAQRAALAARFAAVTAPAEVSRFVLGDLDSYAHQWSTQWDAACHAPDRESDLLLHAQRLTCLENALIDLHGVTNSLRDADLASFAPTFAGDFAHSSLEDCTRTEVLRAQLPAPLPERREAVSQLLLEDQAARAEVSAVLTAGHKRDHLDGALARFDQIAAKLEALGSPAAASAASSHAGYLVFLSATDPKRVAEAHQVVDAAIKRAELDRNDPELAHAHALRVKLELQAVDPDLAKVESDLANADAALARAGHPRRVTSEVMAQRAYFALETGHEDEAARLLRDAIAIHDRLTTFDGRIGGATNSMFTEPMMWALGRLGDRDAAAAFARDVRAKQVAALGEQVSTADLDYSTADLLMNVGDLDGALAAAERTHATESRLDAPVQPRLANLEQLATIALRLDRTDVASTLDELARLATQLAGPKSDPWAVIVDRTLETGHLEATRYAAARLAPKLDRDVLTIPLAFMIGDLGEQRAAGLRIEASKQPEFAATAQQYLAISDARAGRTHDAEHRRLALAAGVARKDEAYVQSDAMILAALGRWPEARAELETARSISSAWTRDWTLGEIDAWLGQARLETGDAKGARRLLEQSIAITDACCNGFHYFLPIAQLALARVLWDMNDDKVRARRLASQARDGFARLGPGREFERQGAIRWLAEH